MQRSLNKLNLEAHASYELPEDAWILMLEIDMYVNFNDADCVNSWTTRKEYQESNSEEAWLRLAHSIIASWSIFTQGIWAILLQISLFFFR